PDVLKYVASPGGVIAVWALGGFLSLIGALVYAELASTYPRSGGDYVYLTRAYGRWVGFLFGWAQLAVVMTGNIGMMAYVFGAHATSLCHCGKAATVFYAAAAVAALTVVNMLGVQFGKLTQNCLSVAKLIGVSGIIGAGFLCVPASATY